MAAGIGAVYSCCSLLADSVASLPIGLRDGENWKTSNPLPTSPLLQRPYAEITRRDWWVSFIWALALRGNFYGRIIERDEMGQPVQIKPIHNDAVQVWRDKTTGRLVYRFYGWEVPLDDVVHVRYQTLPGEIIGLNPIQLLALTFGNAVAKERFVESFYLNSANPMGVIQVPGYLDRSEVRKMLRSWVASHQGLNKANLPAVLTEGAQFLPITISPSDSQLIEALNFSESQICGRIFRVPPHMIGIMERNLGLRGIEQQERSFFANTLVGYLEIGKEILTGMHPPGQWVHFDVTARTRGSTLERAQAGALAMNSGVAVADEIRDWFDWAPLPNGDGQHSYMPINTQLLETAMEVLKQAKQLTAAGGDVQLGNRVKDIAQLPSAPKTVSGAPPRPGGKIEQNPSGKPTRKPSPNGLPRQRDPTDKSSQAEMEALFDKVEDKTSILDYAKKLLKYEEAQYGPKRGNGDMTVEEAWNIVESAVSQAKRMERAADMAMRIENDKEGLG